MARLPSDFSEVAELGHVVMRASFLSLHVCDGLSQCVGQSSWRSNSYWLFRAPWRQAGCIFVRILFQVSTLSHGESSFKIDVVSCQERVCVETMALRPWLVTVLLGVSEQTVL